ncbi:MAG: hypothetical protein HFJ00_02870 [Lachnospiraceae bacterium]|nr:hypothetical protein [Lachnospiraceae bacterium]
MICLWVLLYLYLINKTDKRMETCVKATAIWTLLLLFLSYFWSVFQNLCFRTLAGSYLVIDLALFILLIRGRRNNLKFPVSNSLKRYVFSMAFLELLGILCLFTLVLYYAVRSVPYNWDSMTYHLARIVNWKQNRSVLPYATHIERQVASPVLGAYVNLFVYIIYGEHDRLLNLLQCFSFGANAVLLYGISRKLGIGTRTSFLAPLLYICTPIALAEATTTQVDNFSAFWLLSFIYLMLDVADSSTELIWDKRTGSRVAYAGLCIAFGYLAKPSVCFAILLFLVWLLTVCIKRKTDIVLMVRYVGIAIPGILFPVLPSMILNKMAFGSVSHSAVGQRQLTGSWNPRYLFVNFLKNFTFNLAPARSQGIRPEIEKFLYRVSALLHVDLNAPEISEDGRLFEFPEIPALNCDVALNSFLFIAALCFMIWFLIRVNKESQLMRGFSIYAISSYLVFCCFLRWEKFINRYMISYFALLAVFIVIQVYDIVKHIKKTYVCCGICVALVAGSLYNYCGELQYLRSVCPFSKPNGYFAYHPSIRDEYVFITDEIKNYGDSNVGLILRGDTYEYPVWAMLRGDGFEIKHILVNGELGKYEDNNFMPEYIIAERYTDETISYRDRNYILKMTGPNSGLSLYFSKDKQSGR